MNLSTIIKQVVSERFEETQKYNWKPLNEENIAQRLREDSAYKDFFKATMKKFGVESPKELTGAKKKEFFNYVDKNYKAKGE